MALSSQKQQKGVVLITTNGDKILNEETISPFSNEIHQIKKKLLFPQVSNEPINREVYQN